MKKIMRAMSGRGDEVVAEWSETTTVEQLAAIEAEFNAKLKAGYFAADLGTNELIKEFNPGSDILLIPHMVGGI